MESIRLNETLEQWLLELKDDEKSENTLKKYKVNISTFIEFCKDKELNKQTVLKFKEKIDSVDLFLPNTTNNYIVSINKFLKYVEREDCCVNLLKVQKKYSLEYYLSRTDYRRLLRITKRNEDYENYYIMRILAETGIRISELKYFTVEKLDKILSVRNKGKSREIIIKLDLLRDLRKYARENKIKEGTLFPNPKTGKIYVPSTIWRRLKKIAGQARIKKDVVHAHSFRHLFSKRYLEQYPDDIVGLADILGHNSLETTRIYAKLSNKEKELKLRKVKF